MALKLNPLASQPYKFPSSTRLPISTFRSPMFLCRASLSPAISSGAKEVESLKKPFTPPMEVHVQVLHSLPPQKIEIFKSMEDWAENNLLILSQRRGEILATTRFLT